MISFSILIMNASLILDGMSPAYTIFDRITLAFNLLGGLFTNNSLLGAMLLITASLLSGLNLALLFIKIRNIKNVSYKESGLSSSGTIASIMASGCTSCGISILSIIGFAGILAFLPFNGLELGFAGILLLLFSIYWNSKKFKNYKTCNV
ncbi:MAG: hypothetical protein AABX00_02165 [Nanoarchaeota archaeon]